MTHPHRPLAGFLLGVVCLGCLAGCLLYIPQRYRQAALAGEKIHTERLRMLVPGETTKAEFIDKVGQPYLDLDDFGVMVYYWKMLSGSLVSIIGGGYQACGAVMEHSETNLLLLAYDADGIITKHEIVRPQLVATVNESAITWVGQGDRLTTFTPLTPPPGQAVVNIYKLRDVLADSPGQPSKGAVRWRHVGKRMPDGDISGIFLNGTLFAELDFGQYVVITLPPGQHRIGVEPQIRATNRYMVLQRQAPEPAYTTTLATEPNQVDVLEIFFRDVGLWGKSPGFFRQTLEEAQPRLVRFKRAR